MLDWELKLLLFSCWFITTKMNLVNITFANVCSDTAKDFMATAHNTASECAAVWTTHCNYLQFTSH